ncbi:MAG TPA: hypothetical protein VNL13_00380 [Sulfolobales archaeon]|nr:hypothetical protein [Sulfolobales archaeon]
MNILSRAVKKYSELLAISISSYRDYLSLQRELIIALMGVSLSLSLAMITSLWLGTISYSVGLSMVIAIIGSVLSLHKILARVSRSLEKVKGLSEEMPYLVFMASAIARTGLELIEAIYFVSTSEAGVFRYFKSLSRRLINASKYIGFEEALDRLAGIPREVKKTLITYLSSISLGTGIETLNTLGLEMIREASRRASRSIDLAAQAGLVITMVLTTIPILVLGISSILGDHVALSVGIMVGLVTPIAVLLLPQTPLPLRLMISENSVLYFSLLGILSIGLIVSVYVSIYLLALSIIQLNMMKNIIIILSIAMILMGIPWTVIFINYLAGFGRARDILVSISGYAKAYRTLDGLDLDKETRRVGSYAPWILHYIVFSLVFFREKGGVEPIVITRFSEEIMDVMAKNTNRIVGSLLSLTASLAQPVILTQIVPMMGSAAHSLGTIVMLLSSVAVSSLIASKIFFGTARNTLIMGMCFLLLYIFLLR